MTLPGTENHTQKLNEQEGKAEVISLLEFEIKRIADVQREPGWTKWALLAALGALIWTGFSVIESSPMLKPVNVAYAFILVTMSLDFVLGIRQPFGESSTSAAKNRFRFAKELFSESRVAVVSVILRYVVIGYLLVHFSSAFNPFGRIGLQVFCCVIIVVGLAGIALSFVPLPLSSDRSMGLIGKTFALLMHTLLAAALIVLWRSTAAGNLLITMSEWKLAATCAGVVFVFDLLVAPQKEFPLVQTLVDVRRKLGLGEISTPDARRQLEIALSGLLASDILQTHVEAVLRGYRNSAAVLKTINGEFRVLKDQFERHPTVPLAERKAVLEKMKGSARSRLNQAEKEIDSATEAWEIFRRKATMLGRMAAGSQPEIDRLMSRITDEAVGMQAQWRKEKLEMDGLLNWLKGHVETSQQAAI